MKPTRLELKGFTSFREKTTIDFSGLDLFAITGPTGAGKTSLLDAMTFALYGKTPRLGKAATELISQGEPALTVTLEFQAGAGRYRVTRTLQEHAQSARLEVAERGKWQAISGSPGVIVDRIARIIGLDFEAFNRAVILPQGKFDQFLRGSRKEQRETLGDLLDVDIYRRMAQSANAKRAAAAELVRSKLAEIDPAATPEARLAHERELAQFTLEEEQRSEEVERLRQILPDALLLREKRRARQQAERDLRESEAASAGFDSESPVRLAQLEQVALQRQKLAGQLGELERKRGAAPIESLADAETARRAAAGVFAALRERHGSPDAIEHAAAEWERAHACTGEIAKVDHAIAQLEARAAVSMVNRDSAHRAVEAAEAGLESARSDYEHWHARDVAAALRDELQTGRPCPVCEQVVHAPPAPLDAGEVARARSHMKSAEAALRQKREALAAAQAEADALPGRVELARKKRELYQSSIDAADGRAAQIVGGPVDAASLRTLAEKVRCAESAVRSTQAGYERALADERTAALRRDLAELPETRPLAEIQAARRDAAQRDHALKRADSSRAAIEELDREIPLLAEKVRVHVGRDEPAFLDEIIAAGRKDLESVQARVEKCRFALHGIEEKISRNARLHQEIATHRADEEMYRNFATWLNAGNFQQYLMNSAFELLAHEGSRHLRDLSNGRYTFAYNETEFKVIDRWNGDETRSVSTLSGGESFLGSLALALALAESIAELNSAGSPVALESLFLDEGFSTLDAETQSRVADAMQVLQGGKRLIGVVTHIQSLADQMPHRIEVERTPAGSRIKGFSHANANPLPARA